ncbi:cellulose biosynthesis cyclic di-GMP-binding regulatory protein BcsB [Microvirga pudoricolor]|uniref:cellulose biosynthesis cyclic di-GMP-binding regulatory protein BcsB n=1 Tax=Microvirga pudoricolor TaxID=2778729 RepID=UPI0019525941|nr:cellulose biosynthesis cyclic di-GMP-binding regulatory protein BcsB [Microvirga pudoricolor]MBM6594807.1 cellulose biosynthesis cyclic di-GMP-binding regulatory protein BcsB [Microvirga pudoricolor]
MRAPLLRRSRVIGLLALAPLIGATLALAQTSPFTMSPGQSAPQAAPAQPFSVQGSPGTAPQPAQAPAASPFNMGPPPGSPPANPGSPRGTAPFPVSPPQQQAAPPSARPSAPPSAQPPASNPFSMGGTAQPARPPAAQPYNPGLAAPRPTAPSAGQPSAQPYPQPYSQPAAQFPAQPYSQPPAYGAPPRPAPAVGVPGAFPQAGQNAARGIVRNERPILPIDDVRLEGEVDSRSWAVFLTQDEATGSVSLSVGYQNAIVVMPEVSRLRVAINGEIVMDVPIASSQDVRRVTLPIRAGLLRVGQNTVRMEAVQRHRTDCTVRATYELWTQLDAAATSLIFGDGTQRALRGLDDLPAVGLDTAGVTTIRVIAPRVYRPEMRDRIMRLVQMVALRGRYAHPVVKVFEADPGPAPAGTIKVYFGLAGELRSIMPSPPEAAAIQALALVTQDGGTPALIVSGPTWGDLDTAVNIVAASMLANRPAERNSVDTASWMWPDAPAFNGARSVRFGDMGVPTQEFSGRRFRIRFAIDLPADFYANFYGEATLYLDAAHTPAVRPGSHIDLYVNDRISSTMRITSRGEIFRRHPIRIPMRNFRPGINYISFEAVLLTDADERCPPGGTLSETSRFVLFDSTTLTLPNFGRIGRLPDLAEMSAAGFPLGPAPATVVLARQNATLYSAAGTMLARLARDSGEPVRAQFANAATLGDPSTVFIGAIDQLSAGMLNRVGVSERTKTVWQTSPFPTKANAPIAAATPVEGNDLEGVEQAFAEQNGEASTDDIRRRWDESLSRRSFLQTKLESVKGWIERTFSLSVSTLSFGAAPETAYEPSPRSTLLLAQGSSVADGTWTVLTARTEESLADETARLTDPVLWPLVSGRIVTLSPDQEQPEVQPVRSFMFVQTEPFSFQNMRLVIANWMSINILQYAALLVACCIVLGAATYFLLNRLGRRS